METKRDKVLLLNLQEVYILKMALMEWKGSEIEGRVSDETNRLIQELQHLEYMREPRNNL